MRRLIWLPVAGFLLIAGATVAAAAPTIADKASALFNAAPPSAGAEVTTGTITVVGDQLLEHEPGALLEEVLADLVAQNVITQAQSDAIVEALQTRVDERRAEMQAQAEEMRATWEQIQGFLEDDVITQDEINQLPADSPLRQAFDSIAQDGQITLEQLQQLGPGAGFGFGRIEGGPGRGHHGPGMWFEVPAPSSEASPAPSAN